MRDYIIISAIGIALSIVMGAGLKARADVTVVVDYGPALECAPPVGGVSQCVIKATGSKVQCSMVNNVKVCF